MISYLITYFIIGFVWSFLLMIMHDTFDYNEDSIPTEELEEFRKVKEPYTLVQLGYITITWPFWVLLFLRVWLFNETK